MPAAVTVNIFQRDLKFMFMAIVRAFRGYFCHERGVAAVAFAVMLPVIIASAGVAVDVAGVYNSQQRLANALDKAALAAASSPTLSQSDLQQRFLNFFNANYPPGVYGTAAIPTLTVNGNTMTASASATVPTTFMSILGINNLTINGTATVVETLAGVEAVLVLDTTGSMAGNNIAALRTASTNFINMMFSSITDPTYLKIGIVPWSETVNVGPYGIGKNLDGSTFENGITFVSWPANFPTSFPNHNTDPYVNPASSIKYGTGATDWGGCVMEPSAAAVEEDDPSLIWPMYRYQELSGNTPITTCQGYACKTYGCAAYACEAYNCTSCSKGSPSGSGCTKGGSCKAYGTNCLTPGTSTNGATCTTPGNATNGASCVTPGTSTNGAQCNAWGTSSRNASDLPNNYCTSVPVLPMTNNQAALLAEINALPTANSTYPDIGMVWGWRMISPGFPFTEGASYSDQTWSKTVIMMTDGNATTASVASGEGFAGAAGISTSATDENNKFEQICTNMKAQGIQIYTITFQSAINATTQAYYRDCASQPSMYFNAPSNADLTTAFQAIATQLGQLHLSK